MIHNIKMQLCVATVIFLLTVAGLSRLEVYYLTDKYNNYKENIDEQVQNAKIEKSRVEAEQRAKHDKEIADYAADRDRLKRIIDGLRKPKEKPEVVPGNSSLSVAGSGSGGVPRTPENPSGSINAVTIEARTGSFTYENALMDTLQCSRLIEFVRP